MFLKILPWTRLFVIIATLFVPKLDADDRPNVIVINVDELRWDGLSMSGHPFVQTPHIDRIAREGILMENSFVTTPLCGPSRGCLMTGQYAHTNGSYKNRAPKGHTKLLKTYPMLFQKAGYKTAFIGKWTTGVNSDKTPHPGFDRWFCSGVNRDYKMDPIVNVDGAMIPYKGHATDIDSAETVRFIRENKDHPFNISLWHRSVHTSYGDEGLIAAERNRGLYMNQPIERRLSAHPGFVVQPSLKGFAQKPPTDEDIRNIARMTVDIDDGVGEIYRVLEEAGILDKTMIIFVGDNGFFFGEHGLTEKRLAYEESIRVPFFVRYPPLIHGNSRSPVGVLNIDIAPTLLALAGIPIPEDMHGENLLPVFQGGSLKEPRSALLFEFWPETDLPGQLCWWKAVRTDNWKFVHYYQEPFYDELYDLKNDPYEMNNLIKEKDQAKVLMKMQSELERLMIKYGDKGGDYAFWENL
ncbi:MAG: sulfatase-like hydrolase/transferase [Verrucomicrobia bacterium]|nr:sulfatase-like hydrolase/transferase [Verrucomicrobiota bacterium]MDA1069609.1 sulfatase-like hydrolase/transferase [Verrucomicrobiota bacterium]